MIDKLGWWFAQVIAGLVQGITEVFPVSSSVHTIIAWDVWSAFASTSSFAFADSVYLHIGSLITIAVACRREAKLVVRSAIVTFRTGLTRHKESLRAKGSFGPIAPFGIIIGVLATGLVGLPLRPVAQQLFGAPPISAALLSVNGLCLLAVGIYLKRSRQLGHTIAWLSWWHYALIGVAQGLATVPGISRFGLTLCTALALGLVWRDGLTLSFLLSLPTVVAATVFEIVGNPGTLDWHELVALVPGIAFSALGTWLAIVVIQREDLHAPRMLIYFAAYCIISSPFYSLYLWFLGT